MECYKSNWWRMFYFSHPPLHSICIVITWFGNLVNVLHDYQSIEIGSSSQIVPTLVLTSSSLHGIELGFLRQKSCNQGETIYQDASCYKWCNYWRMRYPSNQRKCGGKIQQTEFNSTHAAIVKLGNLKTRNRRLGRWTLFSPLNW